MRLTAFIMLVLGLHVSAKTVSQSITLSAKEMRLEQVFSVIKEQTGYVVFYTHDMLRNAKPVTIQAKGMSLKAFLDASLKDQPVEYVLENTTILLSPKKKDRVPPLPDAVQAYLPDDPETWVKGVVKDSATGTVLAAAAVFVKNHKPTSSRTHTDGTGHFQLAARPGEVLVISFVGYEEVEYTVKKAGEAITIYLGATTSTMEEVIVTNGYQKIDNRRMTGAVTTIKAKDIINPGFKSIDLMLEGHVPGMTFMQNSGQPGAAPRLRIRGTSTILGTQEPLWVIDGIVQQDPIKVDPSRINDLDFVNLLGNAVSGLNPDDVEQIDVLKDAAATAIYGVRAANGVIVITTKQGKPGPPVVNFSMSSTYIRRPRYSDRSVDVMNSLDRMNLSRQIIQSGVVYPREVNWVGYESVYQDYYNKKITYDQMQQQIGRYETVNTDWFGELMHDAFSPKYSLSLSGGSSNVKYYASLGYNLTNGTIKGEWNKDYTTNMKLTANYNRITVSFGLQGSVSKRQYSVNQEMDYALKTSRVVPAYNEDGSDYFYGLRAGYGGNTIYQYSMINERNNSSQNVGINGIALNATIDYKIVKPLSFSVTGAYQTDNSTQDDWHGFNSEYATALRQPNPDGTLPGYSLMPYGDELKENIQRRESYTARGQLNYTQAVDHQRFHTITAVLGTEISSNRYTGNAETYRGYLPNRGKQIAAVDPVTYYSYATWMESPDALGVRTDELTNLASAYLSLMYSYRDRYVFNFNTRADASNKFGDQSNEKLLPIWSVSGLWNTKGDLLKDVRWVNTLTVKGSFGYQGNILSTQSPELIIQRQGVQPTYGEYYSTISSFPNPNLKWEKTSSVNGGVDFSLFNNKIRGSVSYFYKKTSNAFLSKSISDINGVTSYVVNSGTLENHGIELAFNFTPVSPGGNKNGFRWNIDPQFGQIINSFISKALAGKPNTVQDVITYNDYLSGNVQVIGKPLNTFYSYRFAGLDHNDGRPNFYGIDPSAATQYDKMSNNEDVYRAVMTPSGTRVPTIQGGIANTFAYKSFTLSFNLSYSLGSKIRLAKVYPDLNPANGTNAPSPLSNVRNEVSNRWQHPGDEQRTDIPAIMPYALFSQTAYPWWVSKPYSFATNIWDMYDQSDLRVVSGNYLKMQAISFRYLVPDALVKKMQMKSAYLSLSGTNLFVVSAKELKGQDPTTQTGSGAVQLSVRPTYSFSINVSF